MLGLWFDKLSMSGIWFNRLTMSGMKGTMNPGEQATRHDYH